MDSKLTYRQLVKNINVSDIKTKKLLLSLAKGLQKDIGNWYAWNIYVDYKGPVDNGYAIFKFIYDTLISNKLNQRKTWITFLNVYIRKKFNTAFMGIDIKGDEKYILNEIAEGKEYDLFNKKMKDKYENTNLAAYYHYVSGLASLCSEVIMWIQYYLSRLKA